MACNAQVVVLDDPDRSGRAERLVVGAEAHLRRLEARWSRFLPESDITWLNLACGRPVRVHAETLTLVAAMIQAWEITGGRYDPTVLPELVRSGYRSSVDDPRRLTLLPSGELRCAGMADVLIDREASTVTLPVGVTLDPGGIGKGLAADLAVGRLLDAGAAGALVNVGGDLVARGAAPHPDGWHVEVEVPDRPEEVLCTLAVSEGGVATSSAAGRRWHGADDGARHTIDPASGAGALTDLAAVTVVAAQGWLAEAHATAALLCGAIGVREQLREHGLTGLAVTTRGRVLTTDGLDEISTATSPAGWAS